MSLFPNEDSSSNITVQEIESWKSFADSLKEEDRELFNKMLNDCYKYSNAINPKEVFPAESLLMALNLTSKSERKINFEYNHIWLVA